MPALEISEKTEIFQKLPSLQKFPRVRIIYLIFVVLVEDIYLQNFTSNSNRIMFDSNS
jgi:hypothetical protein